MAAKHPGFKAVQSDIAARLKAKGVKNPEKHAGAILAKKTRESSAGAKEKNPRLKRIKG